MSKTCTVRFDSDEDQETLQLSVSLRNKYSVISTAVGRPVEVHAYAERIVIRQDGVVVAEHPRCLGRAETIYDPWHYVPVLTRKPGALRPSHGLHANRCRATNGGPFRDWVLPAAMAAFHRKLKGRQRWRQTDGLDPRLRIRRRYHGGRGRLQGGAGSGCLLLAGGHQHSGPQPRYVTSSASSHPSNAAPDP